MLLTAIGGGDREPALRTTLDLLPTHSSDTLIIPTACSNQSAFDKKVAATTIFFKCLGVKTSLLHEFDQPPSLQELSDKIGQASLLYTIGGNTPHMMRFLRRHRMEQTLHDALLDHTPHAGTSAGALLPFELAHSNPAVHHDKEDWEFTLIPALGVISHAVATAHANQFDATPYGQRPDSRMENLQTMLPEDYTGYAIDNGAALIIHDEGVEVVQAKSEAGVYRLKQDQVPTQISTGDRLESL